MTKLSFTTMQNLIECPHTFLNKQMGLKTFQNKYMTEGKEAHGIIQKHISGIEKNPLLNSLPFFSDVEQCDFDPNMEVEFPINGKYLFHGYLDAFDKTRKDLAEIKTGTWSMGKFAQLIQWKLYSKGKQDHKKFWFINTPRKPEEWNNQNIKVFALQITPNDYQQADEFIQKAIYIIEHLKDYNLYPDKKSYYCNYINCSFCPTNDTV